MCDKSLSAPFAATCNLPLASQKTMVEKRKEKERRGLASERNAAPDTSVKEKIGHNRGNTEED